MSNAAEVVTLDARDPFDAAIIPLVLTNRRKRADYAKDGDPFSNFKTTSELMGLSGFGMAESALFNVIQKVARLKSLRENGRMQSTKNEAVEDTYLDLAVYSIILYAIVLQQSSDEYRSSIDHPEDIPETEAVPPGASEYEYCGVHSPAVPGYACSAKKGHSKDHHTWVYLNGVMTH